MVGTLASLRGLIKHPAMEEVYWQGTSVDAEDTELVSELLTRLHVFAHSMSEFEFLHEDM